jgi:cytochrome c biogenesis protein CcmG, thiol:disulfide interchange protein DsbE
VKQNSDRWLLGVVVLLAGALVFVVSGTLEQRVTEAGDKAPEFRVLTERGRTVTPKDFGGKLLILNFWASWCPPCVEETPSLNAFAQQMAPQGVVVLGVSVDRNESAYKKFLTQHKIAFDTSLDPEADVSSSYGTFQFPETYIIDSSGKVVEKIISNQNFVDPEFISHISKLAGS